MSADDAARLDGNVSSLTSPMPQLVVIGNRSVGKSRLIEALAGEPFNFVSGTLGSRRPTVLEFKNSPEVTASRWSVFDDNLNEWSTHPIEEVRQIVTQAHEACGNNISEIPIRVKVEGADCTDLSLVDLPGFRRYAKDAALQDLSDKIDKLAFKFMNDESNVMLVVEQAGDAAGYATLEKAKGVDPTNKRTILILNKLDKYYCDLTPENVNQWMDGFDDLPDSLLRFSMTLPHWQEGTEAPMPFGEMCTRCTEDDLQQLYSKGLSLKYAPAVGLGHFKQYISVRPLRWPRSG